MPSDPPRLLVCEQPIDYVRAARAIGRGPREVPVLGWPQRLLGFPPGLELGLADEAPEHGASRAGDAAADASAVGRWVVVIDEPACAAAGELLARATGRRLVRLPASDVAAEFDAELDAAPERPTSITFVLPLWSVSATGLDPRWIGHTLALMRARIDRLAHVAWGIITGADARALSLAVARAVLAPDICAAYADAPAAMMINGKARALGSALPPMPAELGPNDPPLQIIDAEHVASELALAARSRRWSLLYFRGHGRYYCGNEGFLCGARPLHVGPEQPASTCVDGLDCANPHDGAYRAGLRGFPRVDPRSYAAPVLILDTCSAGGWSSPDWGSGRASLAVLAFAGAASAVVCSDYTTIGTQAAHLEVFAALAGAATIGEAVVRLNRGRTNELGGCIRYLLGDPELPLGFIPRSSWSAEPLAFTRERGPAAQRIVARFASGAAFARIPLAIAGAASTTSYVDADADAEPVIASMYLVDGDEPEVWVALEQRPVGATIELAVETHLTPRLPAGLREAAMMAPVRLRAWSDALAPAVPAMLAAAAQLEQAAELSDRVRGRAVAGADIELQLSVPRARQAWLAAHVEAVAKTYELVDRGLWPMNLWRMGRRDRSSSDEPCPRCGTRPTQRLRYRSPPGIEREQWECTACTLVEDRPLLAIPRVSLELAKLITADQAVIATLRFANPTEQYFTVAAAIIVDRVKHNVESPPPLAFELGPGQAREHEVELRSSAAPDIAHRYYARVPVLINGVWLLLTQQIAVRRGTSYEPSGERLG